MKNSYIENISKEFNYYKSLGENTFKQLSDSELQWAPNQDSNSIAIIVKHLSGNMLSRWTNIFLEDGEKPWRLAAYTTDRSVLFDFITSRTIVRSLWLCVCVFDPKRSFKLG